LLVGFEDVGELKADVVNLSSGEQGLSNLKLGDYLMPKYVILLVTGMREERAIEAAPSMSLPPPRFDAPFG